MVLEKYFEIKLFCLERIVKSKAFTRNVVLYLAM